MLITSAGLWLYCRSSIILALRNVLRVKLMQPSVFACVKQAQAYFVKKPPRIRAGTRLRFKIGKGFGNPSGPPR